MGFYFYGRISTLMVIKSKLMRYVCYSEFWDLIILIDVMIEKVISLCL